MRRTEITSHVKTSALNSILNKKIQTTENEVLVVHVC